MTFNPDTARAVAAKAAYPDPGGKPWAPAVTVAAARPAAPDLGPMWTPEDARRILGLAADHPINPGRNWWPEAACLGLDPELFFPERGESPTHAQQVCAGCTARPECLLHSLNANERQGVWGGINEKQRRRIRHDGPAAGLTIHRRAGRPFGEVRHGTVSGYHAELRRGMEICPACRRAHLDAETRRRKAGTS